MRDPSGEYEPFNRLLMDPVLQFQPWLEFNRADDPCQAGCRSGTPTRGAGRLTWPTDRARCSTRSRSSPTSAPSRRPWRGWPPRGSGWPGWACSCWRPWWGFRGWGRWFAGLVYPFCGFLIVWLLYPGHSRGHLASLADPRERSCPAAAGSEGGRAAGPRGGAGDPGRPHPDERPRPSGVGSSSHSGGSSPRPRCPAASGGTGYWAGASGIAIGLLLGAVQILPLGSYLAKSPVWGDRRLETRPWYEAVASAIARRRMHGLALRVRQPAARPSQPGQGARGQQPERIGRRLRGSGHARLCSPRWAYVAVVGSVEATFLAGLVAVGAMGAFRIPPVDNLLRLLPVLEVTDNRRLVLWVAFGLTLLGGPGSGRPGSRRPAATLLDLLLAARGDRPRHGRVCGALARTLPARAGRTALPRVGEIESGGRLLPVSGPRRAPGPSRRRVPSALLRSGRVRALPAGGHGTGQRGGTPRSRGGSVRSS